MDRISRKQRQIERKYDNLRRYAAQEEKYSSTTKSDNLSQLSLSQQQQTSSARSSSSSLRVGTEQGSTERPQTTRSSQDICMDTDEADQQQLLRTASGADTRSVSADPIKRYHSTDPSGTESLRSYPVVVAIQDYVPAPGKDPEEALPLDQGQIVEVLDNKNAAGWLVRTKARPPQTGWVPGSYFETPSKYYTQRRTTRELMGDDAKLDERQQALLKREQVFADLLRTEEDFAAALREAMHYVEALESEEAPEEVKSHKPQLALQLEAMQNFHANVLLKGLQYYSDDPGKVGQTFVRLERDFEMHVSFLRELDTTIRMIQEVHAISQFLEEVKSKSETALRPYTEYLQLVPERVAKYEDFFKEIIKYSTRAQQNTDIMQKALELVQSMPKRAKEIEFTKNILNYPGDTRQLGRIYRHELFQVWEGDGEASEKYVFLFKNKMMLTDRDMRPDPPLFRHYSTIRVDKYTVRQHTTEDETIVFQPNEPGLPSFRMKAKDFESQEFVRKAWLKDISEMQAAIGGSGDKEEEADGQVHQEGATAGGEE